MIHQRLKSRSVLAIAASLAVATGATVLATTAAQAAAGCQVNYTVASSWPGGFNTNVTITNLCDPVSSWRLTWSFGAGQTITQLWGGISSVSGTTQTVKNEAWNGVLAPNATTTFGFLGTWTTANGVPATVTCTRT